MKYDTVFGATFSSNGILEMVANALQVEFTNQTDHAVENNPAIIKKVFQDNRHARVYRGRVE